VSSLLLVDDEPANLLALHGVLEPLGHELVDARSGREALRFLLERRFAVVLMDVRMPDMDGIETAALIRQRDRTHGVPIVFVTAASDPKAVYKGYAEGAADFLVKPFDPEILRAKVQALVVAQEAAVEEEVRARTEAFLQREQQARAEAERAMKLRDQFLATLSHELRTPLMSILGWARLLRLGKASADPSGRALQSIERNARLQARLVDDLLDVQRVESGKMSISFSEVAFAGVLEGALEQVFPDAEQGQVRVRTVLPHDEDLFVFGDAERLQQMVTILLRNAIKFTSQGGNVRAVVSSEDTDLVLTITDDGRGMDADFQPLAFEPFTQQDSRLTRAHGGLGVGLAIVRGVVELHGGTVSAYSAGEGLGSSFLLTLPLRSHVPKPFMPSAGRAIVIPPPVSLQGVSILVVDDDPDAQYLIATMLEQFGGRVTAIGTARDALRVLENDPFDILLSDISMPGEDGYSLIRRVRGAERTARMPAVALTANARPEDRTLALLAGFHAHLAKPVEPTELATVLAAVVRAARDQPSPTPEGDQSAFSRC
jgi:CheY-like chemotaxis protein